MRIAQVSPYDFSYHGGVVTHMAYLSKELARRGHEVTLFAPCARSQPAPDIMGLDLVRLGGSVPVVAGDSVSRISMSMRAMRHMRQILSNEQFDIVHVHEPLMPFLGIVSSASSPWPTVGTFHAYRENLSLGYIAWKPIFNAVADRLDGRIAVSEAAKEFANRYFPSEYRVIPNGLDVERFAKPQPRPSEFRTNAINLLFVGRVGDKRKGLRYVLGAYSTLKWQYPRLRLVVVGAGVPDRDSYRIMGERGIDDVIFAGPVTDEELPAYYQHADIFCAPNTGKESFGLILVEAMASSTPVVASRIPGFECVAEHERDALLVEKSDENAIAAAARRIIEQPQLRRRIVANGRESVKRYTWQRIADELIDYYQYVSDVSATSEVSVLARQQRSSG